MYIDLLSGKYLTSKQVGTTPTETQVGLDRSTLFFAPPVLDTVRKSWVVRKIALIKEEKYTIVYVDHHIPVPSEHWDEVVTAHTLSKLQHHEF